MSKKKIAIFATGWAAENLYQYVTGARKAVEQDSVDLYLFLCYPTFTDKNTHMKGEVNIFQLFLQLLFESPLLSPFLLELQ